MYQSPNRSALPLLSVIFGLIAVLLNALFFGIPLGFLFGLAALVCGIVSYLRYGKKYGLALSLISFLLIVLWVLSIAVPLWVDPTLQIKWKS
ncbi:hypothetical protein [Paenibacillus aestuarii]|uniref:DUF4190 domain-containing protein n=1 Tax=Paenibacillus aestuarii TaxID=516965 RepID=A0ABW0KGV9_9BACL|nr:hypothetical protein [Paenibacillus aestuarii]